jgi:hypothetical protein
VSGVEIKVDGLKEFSRALKRVDTELPKQLRLALNSLSDMVIDDALPGVPKRTGRAARSLKAKSTRTMARVAGGSAAAPYYPWLDFGGAVGRRNSARRPYLKDGRYLYPAYFGLRDSGELTRALEQALTALAASAGLEMG